MTMKKTAEEIFSVNIEYDRLREELIQSQTLWEKSKAQYWQKKYHSYSRTLDTLEKKYQKDFLIRFGAELKRGFLKKEFDSSIFSKEEWKQIQWIMDDAKGYYLIKYASREERKRPENRVIYLKNTCMGRTVRRAVRKMKKTF